MVSNARHARVLAGLLMCLTTAAGAAEAPGAVSSAALLVRVPSGTPPRTGWPVVVLLHGYGVTKEDFTSLADRCAHEGIAAVAVDGPVRLAGDARSWGRRSDRTHTYLAEELTPLHADDRLDFGRPFVGGFSQGAAHAIALVIEHPDAYAGVLAISPAGPVLPSEWDAGEIPHPLALVYGAQESEGIRASAEGARALWVGAGQKVRLRTHPGGHHFPADWPRVLGDALRWLVKTGAAR